MKIIRSQYAPHNFLVVFFFMAIAIFVLYKSLILDDPIRGITGIALLLLAYYFSGFPTETTLDDKGIEITQSIINKKLKMTYGSIRLVTSYKQKRLFGISTLVKIKGRGVKKTLIFSTNEEKQVARLLKMLEEKIGKDKIRRASA